MGNKANVTKNQWINLGLKKFGDLGLEGIKVERMAQELGSSKAGFYWYFKTRDQFADLLVDRWYELWTEKLIKKNSQYDDPLKRMESFFYEVGEAQNYRNVLSQIRKISKENKKYSSILAKAEKERIEFLSQIFLDFGVPMDKSKKMGDFLYSYYIGWSERVMHRRVTKAEMEEQFRLVVSILL